MTERKGLKVVFIFNFLELIMEACALNNLLCYTCALNNLLCYTENDVSSNVRERRYD